MKQGDIVFRALDNEQREVLVYCVLYLRGTTRRQTISIISCWYLDKLECEGLRYTDLEFLRGSRRKQEPNELHGDTPH